MPRDDRSPFGIRLPRYPEDRAADALERLADEQRGTREALESIALLLGGLSRHLGPMPAPVIREEG